MQFRNPEILYFLFLLLIPILIHLFQLQKFKKVAFTNVKLLKEIEQQTRKSSKLKKLLILLSRLLLFTSLIIAFAQPFFNDKNKGVNKETFIYLDNSFSMQAKGDSGELLQKAKNDLINYSFNKETNITLITNNQVFNNVNITDIKNDIINIAYYPIKKDLKTVLLQIQNLRGKQQKTNSDILLISDFQDINANYNEIIFDSLSTYSFTQTLPNNRNNIAMDSVWIKEKNKNNIIINVMIKSYQVNVKNLSISLHINNKLFGKTTVNLDNNSQTEIEFSMPNITNMHGKLILTENNLKFDNTLYFNMVEEEKTKVLVIGRNANYLARIYTENDFKLTTTQIKQLDYNLFTNQDIVIINELESLSNSLINALKNHVINGGNLVIIPSIESDIFSYNKLFSNLNLGAIKKLKKVKKLITTINYEHPFFKNVFQKKITNFQYPVVKSFFETNINSATSLLQFQDKTDFVAEIKLKNSKIYWVASSLNSDNSNFISSPLIVPVFYNFSLKNNLQKQLFYTIGNKNEIILKSKSENDDVVHLVKNNIDFIPLQSKTSNYTKIQTDSNPIKDGIYQLVSSNKTIANTAYNYNREESILNYYPLKNFIDNYQNAKYYTSVNDAINEINDQYKNQNLWQLFIIFALVFLGLEIFLQKFLKN